MSDALRPITFDTYEGQPLLIERLRLRVRAAQSRGESVCHILLHGPPGLGKTTLAHIIANEMGSKAHIVMGPSIEKTTDIFGVLTKLKPGDVLFIDEIHRVPPIVGEYLYPAMEDGCFEVVVEPGGVQHRFMHHLPPFTLIGATTQPGLLEQPMRERFGESLAMRFYTPHVLAGIIRRNADKLGQAFEEDAVRLLASRARGTPRIANHLLRFARDVAAGGILSVEVARESLELQEIDSLGLNAQDRQYLDFLISRSHPVGAQAIAAKLGLKQDTVAGVIEPYLLQCDLIDRTPRGRVATEKAVSHMGTLDSARESFFATA